MFDGGDGTGPSSPVLSGLVSRGILAQLKKGDTETLANSLKAVAKMKGRVKNPDSLLAPFCTVKDLVLDRDDEVGARAAEVLSMVADDVDLTSCAVGVVPTLEVALESMNEEVVCYSLRTLGILASRWGANVGEYIVDSIIDLWSSHLDETVRREADCVLVRMSENHPEIITKLDDLLDE